MSILHENRQLSFMELLNLSRRLADLSVHRLREILLRVEPSDHALTRFLKELLADGERELEAVEVYASRMKSLPGNPTERRHLFSEIVRLHLPSTREWFGEGPLDREAALHFIESLLQEVSRCWARFAGMTENREVQAFLENLSEKAICRLDHVRTAVIGRSPERT